ncbi:MAG: SPOR domain-containing protein [Ignavibacteria bacterium]|nr:SPOR domain-containing protein [Bacteroidota bacterium]MBL7129086.1 SPOR domain-containing protein [Ignavibacteria bacterium]
MKISLNYFVLLSISSTFIFSACTSSDDSKEWDDGLVVVVDTVVVRTDTIKTELKKVESIKLNLTVQLAAFVNKDNADQYVIDARERLNTMVDVKFTKGIYKITVGKFDDSDRANAYLDFVKSKGFEDAFVNNAN